ncbi:hypothetical protein GGP99_001721 [Salinibacter ruber]|uniref:Uncharacterized protein n=2 Tax=Salinibacter ruber TaxID=146919 RepID=A0AAW5P6X5_9BACT|nr:hypothetical protein [Salinibacter ruber]
MAQNSPIVPKGSMSDDGLVALIQSLLAEGTPAREIAEKLGVSGVRLVEAIAGASEKGADAVLISGVPMELDLSSGGVAVRLGSEPRWRLNVNAQSPVPTVRAQAPYLDVSLDMRGEELVVREANRSAAH